VPCCVVVTERDRLVRPREQRALAEALGAPVVTVDADHDAPLVRPERFASAVRHAVETVARAAPSGAQSVESFPTSKRSS
ncbi:MAG: hypothetical protein KY412_04430, partial [Actinobacteria bacterium]|nr:hypothetical protein [Actinomycetota bacterium]